MGKTHGNFEIVLYKNLKYKYIFYKSFLVLLRGVLNYLVVLVPKSNNVFSMIPTTGKITKK
jgi:hypothetical protein